MKSLPLIILCVGVRVRDKGLNKGLRRILRTGRSGPILASNAASTRRSDSSGSCSSGPLTEWCVGRAERGETPVNAPMECGLSRDPSGRDLTMEGNAGLDASS